MGPKILFGAGLLGMLGAVALGIVSWITGLDVVWVLAIVVAILGGDALITSARMQLRRWWDQ